MQKALALFNVVGFSLVGAFGQFNDSLLHLMIWNAIFRWKNSIYSWKKRIALKKLLKESALHYGKFRNWRVSQLNILFEQHRPKKGMEEAAGNALVDEANKKILTRKSIKIPNMAY